MSCADTAQTIGIPATAAFCTISKLMRPETMSTWSESGELPLGLFGPPPLLDSENAESYDELLARISAALKPADILEEIWIRDIVDLVWEALRLRKLKASLEESLKPLLDYSQRSDLAEAWTARDEGAIKAVDELLASAGLTMDAVLARPYPTISMSSNASIE